MLVTEIQGSAYSRLERLLHRLVLQPTVVRNLSFELERLYALPSKPNSSVALADQTVLSDGAVYVCGLARSGTTMLLQLLNQSDVFRSLTYRDMPFVLAPNIWRLLSGRFQRNSRLSERIHGDGVLVDFNSPESFEEVFWRTFSTTTQIQGNCYGSELVSRESLAAFADYRALVSNPRTERRRTSNRLKRYLSKNNNNLLRMASLASDPTATILLVYREPVATARSLHRLHMRFCAESRDSFTHDYMIWLGHHEFGPGHLPFCFARPRMSPELRPDDPNYWLDYWNAVYQHVLSQSHLRLNLISYDVMCQLPETMLTTIFSLLALDADAAAMSAQVKSPPLLTKPPSEFRSDLLSIATSTYEKLMSSNANILKLTA